MYRFLSKKNCIRTVSLSFLVLLMTAANAFAHNVTIFAWAEGDTVYTESKFSGGRVAKEAPVEVYDTAGTLLLSGQTDQNGEFSFKIPKKEALRIVLKAGMGHGNEWVLTAEEIAEAMGDKVPAATTTPEEEPVEQNTSMPEKSVTEMSSDALPALEKMLDKKLAPVLKKLSHLEAKQKDGAGITEILGGIGYILGLIGLAAYIRFKRTDSGDAR